MRAAARLVNRELVEDRQRKQEVARRMTKEADPQLLRMPPFQVLAFAVTHRSVIRRKVCLLPV